MIGLISKATKSTQMHVSVVVFFIILITAGVLSVWQRADKVDTFYIKGETMELEMAVLPDQRKKGLSDRDEIGHDGMAFLFPTTAPHAIWMKDMRFSIDIIWVRGAEIVDIAPSVPFPEPETAASDLPIYQPRLSANMVLELPAGWAQEHELGIGDSVIR